MIRDLKSLYTAIVDNKVVLFETNLRLFVEGLNKLEPDTRNYDYYYREFKKSKHLVFLSENGLVYHLQKIL
jgi:hypothetical protein